MNVCRWIRRQTRSSVYPTDRYSIARQTATSKDALWRNSGVSVYTYVQWREKLERKMNSRRRKKEKREREWEDWWPKISNVRNIQKGIKYKYEKRKRNGKERKGWTSGKEKERKRERWMTYELARWGGPIKKLFARGNRRGSERWKERRKTRMRRRRRQSGWREKRGREETNCCCSYTTTVQDFHESGPPQSSLPVCCSQSVEGDQSIGLNSQTILWFNFKLLCSLYGDPSYITAQAV